MWQCHPFSGMLSSMDLVEVNPQLGTPSQQESTINAGVDVILAAMGKRKQGNVPVGYEIPIPWDESNRFAPQKSEEAERLRRERNVQRWKKWESRSSLCILWELIISIICFPWINCMYNLRHFVDVNQMIILVTLTKWSNIEWKIEKGVQLV